MQAGVDGVLEAGVEELGDHFVDAGDLEQSGEQGEEAEHRHRDLHAGGLLGDVVVLAGVADLGVLDGPGGRVHGRTFGVDDVAGLHQRRGLGVGRAGKDAEDDAEGVDRGHEGADQHQVTHPRVHAAAEEGEVDDLVLGEPARGAGESGQRE